MDLARKASRCHFYLVGMRNEALSQSPVNEPHVDFVSTIVILGTS